MGDNNEMWRRRDDIYSEGDKIYSPNRKDRVLTGPRFWQVFAVACLILLVVFASIIIYLLVGRSANSGIGPTNGSTPQPIVTSQPNTSNTPTPTAQAEVLPCLVNIGTWTNGSSDWKVLSSALLNDGTNDTAQSGGPTIVAPCQLGNTSNYAVETMIQVTHVGRDACFGIAVRGNPVSGGWQGYKAGVGACRCCDSLGGVAYLGGPDYPSDLQAPFDPGTNLHTYRVEVKDNTVKFFIDGGLLLTMTDNRYLTGSEVGLWCQNVQLEVTSFKVTA